MLSLTGSLLDDPANPPALPAISRRTPSASPELPEPPAKRPYRPRVSVGKPAAATPSKAQHKAFDDAPAAAAEDAYEQAEAEAEPEVDTSKMNPRELKKFRKEQEKAKRDARKARKEGAAAEAETGTKRKADEEDGGERKKRKEA